MLQVVITLIPSDNKKKIENLGFCEIINDGTGDKETGNYRICIYPLGHKSDQPWRTGSVTNFPRLELGPWDLLYRALKEIVGKQND